MATKKDERRRCLRLSAVSVLAPLYVLLASATCSARSVTLQWDPDSDPGIVGYKVYYGQDAAIPFNGAGAEQGMSPIPVPLQTSATVSGLDPGKGYFFTVTAYNDAGVESNYSNIVSLPEAVPPSVSLTTPSPGAVSGAVTLAASASDNVGVTKVEFYLDGVLLQSVASSPYLYSWDSTSVANGSHSLSAKAYDAAGNIGESAADVVQVSNGVAPTAGYTLADAQLALQIAVGNVKPTTAQVTRLDVAPVFYGKSSPNGRIDTGDVIVILSRIVGS